MSKRRIEEKKENNRSYTQEELQRIESEYIEALTHDNHRILHFWHQVKKYAKKEHKQKKAASVYAMIEKDLQKKE